MSRNDWYNLGNDIRDIVQNAVDTQDFDKLNQAINGAITGAIKTAEEGLKDAGICRMRRGMPIRRQQRGSPTGHQGRPGRMADLVFPTQAVRGQVPERKAMREPRREEVPRQRLPGVRQSAPASAEARSCLHR